MTLGKVDKFLKNKLYKKKRKRISDQTIVFAHNIFTRYIASCSIQKSLVLCSQSSEGKKITFILTVEIRSINFYLLNPILEVRAIQFYIQKI